MAKKSKKTDSKKDSAKAKAVAAAESKAQARAAALADEAKKARKAADKAVKAAEKAETRAIDAGALKAKPDKTELLKLALRSTEAKLTHTELKVEALQQQIDGARALQEQAAEEVLEEVLVEAAVEATVAEVLLEAELIGDPTASDAEIVEAIAVELDEVVVEAAPEPEPSHEGEAAAAAEVFAAEAPTVTATELTPPLPEQPADQDPSESWTLLRLRQAAKQRGLTGTSNLPKAALLERLRAS